MKIPQFRVRTLLLLTAIMGVVFVVCAKWPVTETMPPSPAPSFSAFVPAAGSQSPALPIAITGTLSYTITRPPTFSEWAIRASIASVILLAVFVLIGAWRARNARSPAN
jgi:hypothetical protein